MVIIKQNRYPKKFNEGNITFMHKTSLTFQILIQVDVASISLTGRTPLADVSVI